ncbi:MAG: DIP1984 family protein, partial [Clostridia bacterium]|nr:DIP1984 family protein [Clostridia bacterium]
MKLAEALIERADLQKRIDQLEDRLQSNGLVQDGEEPAEDPVVLLAELTTLSTSLEDLITRINLT